ncbi:MAG: MaoC/PaaZ C-terminal domain-containing protein [Desulfobacterales bacterium]|nr:MaoC/PaaZ C-terminal domain-containing protein [Desulfobacterales bacterium]MDX2509084.1 MaoC/PaaZ C-terminal domain-containing protein [Desulfobacterales bacterium]
MKINPDLVGTPLKNYQTKINWQETTNYAAAIEDNNPKYFDDSQEDPIVVHPMFAVSVTWPILSRLEKFIESKDFPKEILLTQVHYSEHLILHRLIRPKDELSITGSLKAFLPHRAGTHTIVCLDAKDMNGDPVFTEYIGAMLRGVACGEGGKVGDVPLLPENNNEVEPLWTSSIHIDPLRPYVYDGCSNIEFPIHTSPKFAHAVGLPGIILQGTATLAYAIRELVNIEADKDPARISEIACRFTGMVLPGTDIKVCCTGKKSHKDFTDVFFEVQNDEQIKAIRTGYVKIMKRRIK